MCGCVLIIHPSLSGPRSPERSQVPLQLSGDRTHSHTHTGKNCAIAFKSSTMQWDKLYTSSVCRSLSAVLACCGCIMLQSKLCTSLLVIIHSEVSHTMVVQQQSEWGKGQQYTEWNKVPIVKSFLMEWNPARLNDIIWISAAIFSLNYDMWNVFFGSKIWNMRTNY